MKNGSIEGEKWPYRGRNGVHTYPIEGCHFNDERRCEILSKNDDFICHTSFDNGEEFTDHYQFKSYL